MCYQSLVYVVNNAIDSVYNIRNTLRMVVTYIKGDPKSPLIHPFIL